MSHPALATIADWLSAEDGEYSINTLLTSVPLYGEDALPDTPPAVIDEWRDDWVANGLLPDSEDVLAGITTPCVIVRMLRQDNSKGPDASEAATMSVDGLFRFQTIVAVRGPSTAALGRSCFYIARCVHGSLLALSQGTDTERAVTGQGIRLGRLQSIGRSGMAAPIGDITGVTGWDVTFAITETVPVSF